MTQTMTIDAFLTEDEIRRAAQLEDRIAVRDQLIIPNMDRINAALGQNNDPDYLAYAVEYVMIATGHW